jgi:hypothetical protein
MMAIFDVKDVPLWMQRQVPLLPMVMQLFAIMSRVGSTGSENSLADDEALQYDLVNEQDQETLATEDSVSDRAGSETVNDDSSDIEKEEIDSNEGVWKRDLSD